MSVPRTAGIILALAAIAALSLYLLGSAPILSYPDTKGYLSVALGMVKGEFWFTQDSPTLSFSWAVRTPGYPLLLIPGLFVGDHSETYIRILHAALGGAAAAALASVAPLGATLRARACAVAAFLGVASWIMRIDFTRVLTEWPAFCCLVISLCYLFRFLATRRATDLMLLSTAVSFAVLIRPVLVVALVLPVLGAILVRPRSIRRALAAVGCGSVLLVGWLAFNTYRFGAPSITPFLGFNAIGVAGFLPAVDPALLPPGANRDFGRAFVERRVVDPGLTLPFAAGTPSEKVLEVYNRNAHEVAGQIAIERGRSAAEANALLVAYARTAILNAPKEYLAYVRYALGHFLHQSRFGIAAALVVLLCCVLLGLYSHAVFIGSTLYLHLSVIVGTSMVETYLSRYCRVTLACCWLGALIGMVAILIEVYRRSRLVPLAGK